MFPWLLIVVAAYLIIKLIIGYNKGFTKMAVSLGATILSVILILVLADTLTGFLVDHTELDENISNRIGTTLLDTVSTEESLNEKIDGLPLPEFIRKDLKSKVAETQGSMAERVLSLSYSVALKLIRIGVYVVGFIVLWILIQVLGKVINLVAKLPVLKEANKILGIVLSLIEGLIVIDVALVAVSMFSGTDFGTILMNQIQGSSILTWLFNHNLVAKLLGM